MVGAGDRVGEVAELWRYPVKSLGGERIEQAACDERGLDSDRRWAVRGADGKLGSGKTTRRFRRMPGLLSLASSIDGSGRVWVRFPDGARREVDDADTARRVSDLVGEPVELVEESGIPHFDDAPIHLISRSTLAWLGDAYPDLEIERRRFRPNLVVDTGTPGRPEDEWIGRRLRVGSVVVELEKAAERCVMVTMAQPVEPCLPPAHSLLRRLERDTGSCIGVYARVVEAGTIAVGDPVVGIG